MYIYYYYYYHLGIVLINYQGYPELNPHLNPSNII